MVALADEDFGPGEDIASPAANLTPYALTPDPEPAAEIPQQDLKIGPQAQVPRLNQPLARVAEAGAPATAPPAPPLHPLARDRFRGFERFSPSPVLPHPQWGKLQPHHHAGLVDPNIFNTRLMPNDREAINVVSGAGKQLSLHAAPGVAYPMGLAAGIANIIGPFFDLFGQNRFSRAYRNQRLAGMEEEEHNMMMNRERMLDYIRQATAVHKQYLSEYGEVFSLMDEAARAGKHLDPEMIRQRIKALNIKWNHRELDAWLDTFGPGGVQKHLDWENTKFNDVMSGYISMTETDKARRKKDTGSEEPDSWMEGGGRGAAGGGGILGPSVSEGRPGPEPAGDIDAELRQKFGLNDEGIDAAHKEYVEGQIPGMTKTDASKRHSKGGFEGAEAGARVMDKRTSDILNGPGDEEDKLEAIRKIDPTMAGYIDDVSQYKMLPPSLPKDTRSKITGWAHLLNPNYDENQAANIKKMYDFGTAENREVQAISNFPVILTELYKSLGPDEDKPIIMAELERAYAGHVTSDPRYMVIANQLRLAQTALNAIQTGTGSVKVSLINRMVENLGPTAQPRAIRQVMMGDTAEVWGRAALMQQQYNRMGGRGYLPGSTSMTFDLYSGFLRSNPNTGQFPDDERTPPQLKRLSRDPAKANPDLRPEERFPPYSEDFLRRAKQYYYAHQNDPNADPDLMRAALESQSYVDPPWEIRPPERRRDR